MVIRQNLVIVQSQKKIFFVVVHVSTVGICRYHIRKSANHAAKSHPGIGAVGLAMARFFHPSQKNRDKWPHEERRLLAGVLVTGEGVRRVQHKDQMCYLVRINNINNSTIRRDNGDSNGKGATGNKVNNDGNSAMGNNIDDDVDGAPGDGDDDNDNGATGCNNKDDVK